MNIPIVHGENIPERQDRKAPGSIFNTVSLGDLVGGADAERRALVDAGDLHVQDRAAAHAVARLAPGLLHEKTEPGPGTRRKLGASRVNRILRSE